MKKNILYLIIVVFIYLSLLYINKPEVFTFKFDFTLVKKYFLSQDITHEVPGKRLFLSDGEIHNAAGYLYTKGYDPSLFNFQHPPLIKYLFGYSIRLFNNPYYVQILFSIFLLILTYLIGIKTFNKPEVSLLSCLLISIDPLFLDISSHSYLDLGQTVFLLLYFYLMMFFRKRYVIQGIALGLLISSKFWAGSLFFMFLIGLYLIYVKKFNIKNYLIHLFIGLFVFSLTYIRTFINQDGLFNIVFFQLKILKYWFNHSVTSLFGSSFMLFITGFFKSWWGEKLVIKSDLWSFSWPLIFFVSIWNLYEIIKSKKIITKTFIGVILFLYLCYLSIQAPFARYFILVLPFGYLTLSDFIFKFARKINTK